MGRGERAPGGGSVATRVLARASGRSAPSCDSGAWGGPLAPMEFLNFVIILVAAWLVWRRPERERLAFGLLVASCLLMALLFFVGARGSLVPGVNL